MKALKILSVRNFLKLSLLLVASLPLVSLALSDRFEGIDRAESSVVRDAEIAMSSDQEKALAAFSEAVKVFFSARCANCHPAGDIPSQGDEMTPHAQGVTRGKAGKGVYGMACTTCHQAENLSGEHMPPGVSNGWHMPPADQKMIFQGLTAAQLCVQLKDPKRNGGRNTPEDAIHHLEEDPLVQWAWAPGNGRTVPPMSYPDFLKAMKMWVESGAACPE